MATRLKEQGTLQCAQEPDQTTGRRLRHRRRIRLHDGPPRAAVRAETADCAEERLISGDWKACQSDKPKSFFYENQIVHLKSGFNASGCHRCIGGYLSLDKGKFNCGPIATHQYIHQVASTRPCSE